MQLEPTSYFLSNQIGSIYSAIYMSKVRLAWSQGMAVSGRRSVPGQRSPLVAARLHPLQDSIRRLCGTKDISSLFFLCMMVSTWHHPRKECALTTTGLQAIVSRKCEQISSCRIILGITRTHWPMLNGLPHSATVSPFLANSSSPAVSRSEVLGRFYNPNTTPKRQRESSGLPAQNWTGVALKGVLHQGD